jgi:hypothetical protein
MAFEKFAVGDTLCSSKENGGWVIRESSSKLPLPKVLRVLAASLRFSGSKT